MKPEDVIGLADGCSPFLWVCSQRSVNMNNLDCHCQQKSFKCFQTWISDYISVQTSILFLKKYSRNKIKKVFDTGTSDAEYSIQIHFIKFRTLLHLATVGDLYGYLLISKFTMKGNSTDDISHAFLIWCGPSNGSIHRLIVSNNTSIKGFFGSCFNIVIFLIVEIDNVSCNK